MSKQHHIRWKQSDNRELARVVHNFNAKITRLEKKNPELKEALPDKVSVKQLKNLIQTRKDLNRELKSLKRFSQRGAEEIITYGKNNIVLTKWQKKEMSIQAGIINRRRTLKRIEYEETELERVNKKLGYKRIDFGMGPLEKNQYRHTTPLTWGMSQSELKRKIKSYKKQVQSDWYERMDEQWRENYITSLEQNFNPHDVEDIIDHISNMDINEFTKIMRKELDIFEKSYPGDKEASIHNLSEIKAIWLPKTSK